MIIKVFMSMNRRLKNYKRKHETITFKAEYFRPLNRRHEGAG